MIDIEKASIAFNEYAKKYDMNNKKIAMKFKHIYKTVEVAKEIAEDLKLDSEQVLLSELIALLHDIGRFEQLKIYDTFNDRESIDHAELGVKILFENGLIRKFIKEDKYDEIIYIAIKNHNKYKIENGLNEEELLQAKIIRDADKTDIFRIFVEDIETNAGVLYNYKELSKQTITPKIMNDFLEHKQSNREDSKKEIDCYINNISFIFDYNFLTGLKIIKSNNYIEKMMRPISIFEDTKQQMQTIAEIANKYINQRIEKGC